MAFNVLCVGTSCVDICFFVPAYPEEDTDTRCLNQVWTRGGNASNNCTVLSQIGCELFCTFARDPMLNFLHQDLEKYDIKYGRGPVYDGSDCPNSTVIISEKTGSRTIVHANLNLTELKATDFEQRIKPTDYAWMHFEGRNVEVFKQVIGRFYALSRPKNERPPISVEIEKMKPGMIDFLYLADVIFFSKDFATLSGQHNMTDAVRHFSAMRPGVTIICAWGDQGAAAYDPATNQIVYSAAFPPPEGVVDTLAAGDTFNAGVISRLVRGETTQQAIEFACRLAGAKCGRFGLTWLSDLPLVVAGLKK